MKSSPAGRAGIHAVSLLGAKLGVAFCPAPSAESAGQSMAMQVNPARRAFEPIGFSGFRKVRACMNRPSDERFLIKAQNRQPRYRFSLKVAKSQCLRRI